MKAVIAGLLLGFAAFFLKLVMSEFSIAIIYSSFAWITLIFAVAGFLLMQKSLQGYISRIIPIITGVTILVSLMLAFVFLGENISYISFLGIFLVLAGVFGLAKL
jgi:transporter family protein